MNNFTDGQAYIRATRYSLKHYNTTIRKNRTPITRLLYTTTNENIKKKKYFKTVYRTFLIELCTRVESIIAFC